MSTRTLQPERAVECGVPSAARALPTGPVGAMSRRYRASASNQFRPQNLIGRANSNRQQRTRTTHFNFGSCRRSMAALNASLPSRFVLCGGPETVERLLAAANRGFQRSHALCERLLYVPRLLLSQRVNRLFRAENNFSGVEFCTGNLLPTPIDTCSEVSMKNKPPAILQSDWSIARN